MSKRACWCGNENNVGFTESYEVCANCGTLVSFEGLSNDELKVVDDESDFYGKRYWLEHQGKDLGYPDIFKRSHTDLVGRNLHWLRTLLQYKAPPAKVLELGCSHGSFVALLKMAGYDASGMEMSPWVVDYAKATFDISVDLGPIEASISNREEFDIIVLMDVLEHLPSPKQTLLTALNIMKPDGIMMIQMPAFPGVSTFEELKNAHASFLGMLLPDEHIYLYSQDSAQRLFHELGAEHLIFEKPFFQEHDMFFVVSRQPIVMIAEEYAEKSIETPNGRFVQALLDQEKQIKRLDEHVKIIDADRAARLDAINSLDEHIKFIDADRAARLDQINTLTKMVHKLQGTTAAAAAEK